MGNLKLLISSHKMQGLYGDIEYKKATCILLCVSRHGYVHHDVYHEPGLVSTGLHIMNPQNRDSFEGGHGATPASNFVFGGTSA
ncbi:hypothetical protein TNCV_4198101 [Trichonephila clavipes]|nr:hypothetical protein TNCV_4198101 [Trichonephila clavipes]